LPNESVPNIEVYKANVAGAEKIGSTSQDAIPKASPVKNAVLPAIESVFELHVLPCVEENERAEFFR
jgi:hypothetical protein